MGMSAYDRLKQERDAWAKNPGAMAQALAQPNMMNPLMPGMQMNPFGVPIQPTGTRDEIEKRYQDETALRAMPQQAEFKNLIDPSGNLLDQYKLADVEKLKNYDPVTMDPRAINEIRNRAFSTGPSQWEQLMMNRQQLDQQNQMDKAVRAASTQSAQGLNSLMQRGGASGGAMERMASQASRDAMFNRNAVGRQGMTDRLGIGLAGQQEKTELLKALPGFESQQANLALENNKFSDSQNRFNIQNATDQQRFNLQNALKGMEMANTHNDALYQAKLALMGANRQADATERSGK